MITTNIAEMIDLTQITTPFGLLDPETQAALKAHGGPYECYRGEENWGPVTQPKWELSTVYRVKHLTGPVTKPSIDWSHLKPEIMWLARDEDGQAFGFTTVPKASNNRWWYVRDDGYYCVNGLASFDPGTCDWRDSLVERPEGV